MHTQCTLSHQTRSLLTRPPAESGVPVTLAEAVHQYSGQPGWHRLQEIKRQHGAGGGGGCWHLGQWVWVHGAP